MNVGIIGLPQTGKTTIFNALTGAHGEVGGYHTGGATSVATLQVPDERLEFLTAVLEPKKTVHAAIGFEDIAGTFAHMGQSGGDSARAFATARDMAALLVVIRCFADARVPHVLGGADPGRDYVRMNEELLLADLGVVESRIEHVRRDMKRPTAEREDLLQELELLERCREAIEQEQGIRTVQMNAAQEKMLRSYAFLTLKPLVCVLNLGESQMAGPPLPDAMTGLAPPPVAMCGRLEMEMADLDEEDRALFMEDAGLTELASRRLVRACYQAIGLRTFFSYAHDEVRAWTVQAGDHAVAAAGKVHTDMARGFIRAEVVHFDDLQACGSIREARTQGKVRLEGKDYEVQDGDVITFRFST